MTGTGRKQAWLAVPSMYNWLQRLVRAKHARRRLVEFIAPRAGDRILDIGCGTSDILSYLPEVSYVGYDMSAEYIQHSREKHQDTNAEFHCCSVRDIDLQDTDMRSFDRALALGVLHHLDDSEVSRLLEMAWRALKPGGRLVTVDGMIIRGQNCISRRLLLADRGAYVRTPKEYMRLFKDHFRGSFNVYSTNLLRIPYNHIIFVAKAS